MAVLMPTSSPRAFTSAPPELPGLIAASVWMKSSYSAMPTLARPTALTIPIVTVWLRPNGLPMASTYSPTWSLSESAQGMVGRPVPSTLATSTKFRSEPAAGGATATGFGALGASGTACPIGSQPRSDATTNPRIAPAPIRSRPNAIVLRDGAGIDSGDRFQELERVGLL